MTIAHNLFEHFKSFIEIHWALREQSSVFSRGATNVLMHGETAPPSDPPRLQ